MNWRSDMIIHWIYYESTFVGMMRAYCTVCSVLTHWILHLSSPPFWRRPRKLEIRYQPLLIIFHHFISFYFSRFGSAEIFIISIKIFHKNLKIEHYEYHRGNKLDEYSILGQNRHWNFWMCNKVSMISIFHPKFSI